MKNAVENQRIGATLALLIAAAACGSNARSACKQQAECLGGSDSCSDCSKDNFVDVCEANALEGTVGYDTCDDEKCKEASSLFDDYYACLADASCDDHVRSRDPEANFSLCKAEAQKLSDAAEACKEAKKNSCDF